MTSCAYATPTEQAKWDFNWEGANCNPYAEGCSDWQQYEQEFDQLCLEAELKITNEEAA